MDPEPSNDVTPFFGTHLPKPPSQEQQAWGAVISIVVIVLMIVIGAFYAWGKRISQQQPLGTTPADQVIE
ncbi:hypothetical protein COU19_03470 [Candidatus Kaiserbacteria bacterium CG10_big_fil_rev_8_21_14_0_10_56_12]|uniref:Uncharacterized protein n=1 Tax=Candidatus Kaiserbacteria bacterium CG10_big_fil_rev_8_21_14_0_10_56_12 TaxID=1974611 RepID=A0A2H0U8Z0_9BACT|nr:MAG: hypothetical protein COU19_03470 [Candidatus Kaiserbacteria bacterium CG10_big_fil_rev_8_21_14_0_10_56_12]